MRYKWSIILALLGLGLGVAAVFPVVELLRETGTRFLGPGESTVTITKAGDYTLWHESKTLIDGQFLSFPDDLPSGTTINVLKQPEGAIVPLTKQGGSSVEVNGKRRVSAAQLTFATPGRYRIVVGGLPEKRAFYLDESKFFRVFIKVSLFGLAASLCVAASIISGIYISAHSDKC